MPETRATAPHAQSGHSDPTGRPDRLSRYLQGAAWTRRSGSIELSEEKVDPVTALKSVLFNVIRADASETLTLSHVLSLLGCQIIHHASLESLLANPNGGIVFVPDGGDGQNVCDAIEKCANTDLELGIAGYAQAGSARAAVRAIRAGAMDYLLVTDGAVALENDLYALAPTLIGRLRAMDARRWLNILTPRETQVLDYSVKGFGAKEIGEMLGVSHRTVEAHRARIMAKLHVRRFNDVVALALLAGFGKGQAM